MSRQFPSVKFSVNLRNWGPQSQRTLLEECARAADASRLDTLWVNEHIAVPADLPNSAPEDFASGRQLDPLGVLAFIAGVTRRIGLGTAVLLLPYRRPLQTAKLVATVQELSGGRMRLGVGAGWMPQEFRALGVERSRRGALADEALELLNRCFADDVVEIGGERLLFRPRPERPPIYVGGGPPHALRRAVRFGDGWIPAGAEPEVVRQGVAQLRDLEREAGREPLEVIAMKTLPLADPPKAVDYARQFAEAGATHLVHTQGYADAAEYRHTIETLEQRILPAFEEEGR